MVIQDGPCNIHGYGADTHHYALSKTINAYKTTTSKQIHLAGNDEFPWQRSFHDYIICGHDELNAARNYIKDNPRHGCVK